MSPRGLSISCPLCPLPPAWHPSWHPSPPHCSPPRVFGVWVLAARGHGDRINGPTIPSRAMPKGWKYNAVSLRSFGAPSPWAAMSIHPGILPVPMPPSSLGSVPAVPTSPPARLQERGRGMAAGTSPPPSAISRRQRQQLPFPSPGRGYGAPAPPPTGNLHFPLPPQINGAEWSLTEAVLLGDRARTP